jgi:hypothetical protein
MSKPTQTKRWIPPKDIDKECLDICEAMNLLPGLRTIESCCGHGKTPYWIFFHLDEDSPDGLLDGLPMLLYWMRHFKADCHKSQWRVFVSTDCAGDVATFTLEGPIGPQGVKESKALARALKKGLKAHLKDLEEFAKEFPEEFPEEFAPPTPLSEQEVSPAAHAVHTSTPSQI